MLTIFVTGAHGFIGRHLAQALGGAGHAVAGIGHGAWPAAAAARWGVGHWLNGDLSASNLNALRTLAGPPDVVMHLAGGSSVGAAIAQPKEDFARTVASTVELFEWLRQESPQTCVVAVSSAAVYGAGHAGQIGENTALTPYSPYGHHKAMMESLCRSYGATYGLRSAVARLFSVYGAGLRKQLLWDLCSKLEAGQTAIELGGSGGELRDWTDVRDVVHALAMLPDLASAQVPTFNLGSGVATSVRNVAGQVMSAWQPSIANSALGFSGKSRSGDPFSLQADASRLTALGFEWRLPLNQGLADYVRWFQARDQGRF
ncbi:MAG: SDR family oxidoreductase [Rhizobacter sp.]|nr:SDR family oxidoreductase [Rhizobacter sp.]